MLKSANYVAARHVRPVMLRMCVRIMKKYFAIYAISPFPCVELILEKLNKKLLLSLEIFRRSANSAGS